MLLTGHQQQLRPPTSFIHTVHLDPADPALDPRGRQLVLAVPTPHSSREVIHRLPHPLVYLDALHSRLHQSAPDPLVSLALQVRFHGYSLLKRVPILIFAEVIGQADGREAGEVFPVFGVLFDPVSAPFLVEQRPHWR